MANTRTYACTYIICIVLHFFSPSLSSLRPRTLVARLRVCLPIELLNELCQSQGCRECVCVCIYIHIRYICICLWRVYKICHRIFTLNQCCRNVCCYCGIWLEIEDLERHFSVAKYYCVKAKANRKKYICTSIYVYNKFIHVYA